MENPQMMNYMMDMIFSLARLNKVSPEDLFKGMTEKKENRRWALEMIELAEAHAEKESKK